MREHPVFIPHQGRYLAAVITVPQAQPRGLVVLMPGGGGAPRSQRYSLWAKVARALAELDIAAVRLEWPGIGDSTGDGVFNFNALPVAEACAVARFAMDATGTTRVGMMANCGGGHTALQAAATALACDALALLLLKPLAGGKNSAAVRRARRLRGPGKWVARRLFRAFWSAAGRDRVLKRNLIAAHRRGDVLLLEPSTAQTGSLPRLVARLQRKRGHHRIELRDLPVTSMQEFSTEELQRLLIDAATAWFDRSFPPCAKSEQRAGNIAVADGERHEATATQGGADGPQGPHL